MDVNPSGDVQAVQLLALLGGRNSVCTLGDQVK